MGRRTSGYSYVEVMVAAVLLSVSLVPATEALRVIMGASTDNRQQLTLQYAALARMESTLAQPFAALEQEASSTGGTTSSSYSDPVGTPNRIVVFVAPHDIDNVPPDNDPLTDTDPGVVRVRVLVSDTTIHFEQVVGDFR